jgi:hypothetical protein
MVYTFFLDDILDEWYNENQLVRRSGRDIFFRKREEAALE